MALGFYFALSFKDFPERNMVKPYGRRPNVPSHLSFYTEPSTTYQSYISISIRGEDFMKGVIFFIETAKTTYKEFPIQNHLQPHFQQSYYT